MRSLFKITDVDRREVEVTDRFVEMRWGRGIFRRWMAREILDIKRL